MKFRKTEHFDKCFKKLPPDVQDTAKRCFEKFKERPHYPYHPSLKIKKMKGYEGIWEGHVTTGYVFTFHIEKDNSTGETIIYFRKIGTHKIYDSP